MHARSLTLALGGFLTIALLAATPAVSNATIDASNVDTLQPKWEIDTGAPVYGSPKVANDMVYFGSANGIFYAVSRHTGSIVWSFDTAPTFPGGVRGSAAFNSSGDVCFGASDAHVWCRDALTGAPVWDTQITPRRACNEGAGYIQCLVNSDCPAASTCGDVDDIWSALHIAGGRVFVSIASHLDNPCTKGRLVALDEATGGILWELDTVPDTICDTDTTLVCTADSDCPASGSCIEAIGAGVTATVSSDPTNSFVYMNTVGCFTYPSVGDSDTIFKVDAATGVPVWKTRVDVVEQWGACLDDASIQCGADSDCPTGACSRFCRGGIGTACTADSDCDPGVTCDIKKAVYQDFGSLNGPVPVDVGPPVNKTLLITGSKNGTLYALDEATGGIEWSNAVAPKPATPGFAGFGLFNGPVAVADGRVYAALYDHIPGVPPPFDRIRAWDVTDGSEVWSDDAGLAWSGASYSNGVVYTGNNVTPVLTANDAVTGARLHELPLNGPTVSVATVDGDSLYVGYGTFGPGGIQAFDREGLSKCRRTVNKETAKFLQAESKTISKCELSKVKGKIAGSVDCVRDDAKTVEKLVKIESKKVAKLNKACGGDDKTCGGDLTDEIGSQSIGFGASCPGFEGLGLCTGGSNDGDVCSADSDCAGGGTCASCDGAIAADDCSGAVTCVDCVAAVATRQMNDLLVDNLVSTDPTTQKDENKCQQTIIKEAWKFYQTKSKILQKCWDKRILGKHSDFCPDAGAATGSEAKKAADKIAKAESKKVAKICKKCGGDDKLCNGVGDIVVGDIYTPVPTCPAVTLPVDPFTDCGAITIASMQDLVDCIDCVAEFKVDCSTLNQVPSQADYPAACQ